MIVDEPFVADLQPKRFIVLCEKSINPESMRPALNIVGERAVHQYLWDRKSDSATKLYTERDKPRSTLCSHTPDGLSDHQICQARTSGHPFRAALLKEATFRSPKP
jgi:hypothetical protein